MYETFTRTPPRAVALPCTRSESRLSDRVTVCIVHHVMAVCPVVRIRIQADSSSITNVMSVLCAVRLLKIIVDSSSRNEWNAMASHTSSHCAWMTRSHVGLSNRF
jgi:hypothetical protein